MTMGVAATGKATGRLPWNLIDVLRSEFCKLRSVRSTYWLMFATVIFNVGIAAPVAMLLPEHLKENFDPVSVSLGGLHLSQIAVGVLGVLVIGSEYDTGLVRSTLSAVPQRGLVLLAKAVSFTVSVVSVGLIACFTAYFVFQASLADEGLRSSIDDPGVLRAISGGCLYLTVLGLMGVGLGAMFRGSAAAIAVLLGMIFVPQLLIQLAPLGWQTTIAPYLPMEAGRQIYSANHEPGSLEFWSGLSTLAIYAGAALVGGFVVIMRRDA